MYSGIRRTRHRCFVRRGSLGRGLWSGGFGVESHTGSPFLGMVMEPCVLRLLSVWIRSGFERSAYIPQTAKLFGSTQYLTELGQDLCDRPLASEKDWEAYQTFSTPTARPASPARPSTLSRSGRRLSTSTRGSGWPCTSSAV